MEVIVPKSAIERDECYPVKPTSFPFDKCNNEQFRLFVDAFNSVVLSDEEEEPDDQHDVCGECYKRDCGNLDKCCMCSAALNCGNFSQNCGNCMELMCDNCDDADEGFCDVCVAFGRG